MALTTVKSDQIQSSVALAGSPTTTTQSASDNSTKVATTAYVETAVANLVASAPSALNTLDELAAALNDDASFSTTVTNSIATKLPLAGGTMTGDIAMGTNQIIFDNNSQAILIKDAAGTASYVLYQDNADTLILGNNTNVEKIRLDTSGNEGAVVINTAGNVGIGAATPSSYYSKNLVVMTDGDGSGGMTLVSPATDDVAYYIFADGTSGSATYAGYLGYSHNSDSMFMGTAGTTKMTITSTGLTAVGGNHTPSSELHVKGADETQVWIDSAANTNPGIRFLENGTNKWTIANDASNDGFFFYDFAASAERIRIDSSGRLLVGKVSTNYASEGIELRPNEILITKNGLNPLSVRGSGNGSYISINNAGTTVGAIGSEGGDSIFVQGGGSSGAGMLFHGAAGKVLPVRNNASIDNTIDLGQDTRRFKDLWLSGGAYLGGTAAANKLDQYKSLTAWTPVIYKGSSPVSSYTTQIGHYLRVGGLVFFSFYCYKQWDGTGKAGSANWRVYGLPFNITSLTSASYQTIHVGYFTMNGSNIFNSSPHRWQGNSTTYMEMYGTHSTSAWSSGIIEFAGSGVISIY